MDFDAEKIKLLLVDDEEDFRKATTSALQRRGFTVTEAESGAQAIELIQRELFAIIVLDLRMPGLSGIDTLKEIRRFEATLPVIILTGHGSYHDALAGINLEIVDFIQKPVEIDFLEARIRRFLEPGVRELLRERKITELMASPSIYPMVYDDQPIRDLLKRFRDSYLPAKIGEVPATQIRSALVYDRTDRFKGIVRFHDLLRLVLPPFLSDSPYTTYFTGMFLAQTKMIAVKVVGELLGEFIYVESDAPLMQAVHLMHQHWLNTLPVMRSGELLGILREKDLVLHIADNIFPPDSPQ